ncbi:MAG: YihY/virulence factor BrkB family protein [Actinomycetota bacterium]|nr:YihY/virulence factor BrkB family protein [Actinomycetota bacterium]
MPLQASRAAPGCRRPEAPAHSRREHGGGARVRAGVAAGRQGRRPADPRAAHGARTARARPALARRRATFYAGVAVVPALLVAIWGVSLVLGEVRVSMYGDEFAAALPAALGAPPVARGLVQAAAGMTVLLAVVPATLYGEGLRRAFAAILERREQAPGWRGRLQVIPVLAVAPLVALVALGLTPRLGELVGSGSRAARRARDLPVLPHRLARDLPVADVRLPGRGARPAVLAVGGVGWGTPLRPCSPASCRGSCCSSPCPSTSAGPSGGLPPRRRDGRSRPVALGAPPPGARRLRAHAPAARPGRHAVRGGAPPTRRADEGGEESRPEPYRCPVACASWSAVAGSGSTPGSPASTW